MSKGIKIEAGGIEERKRSSTKVDPGPIEEIVQSYADRLIRKAGTQRVKKKALKLHVKL